MQWPNDSPEVVGFIAAESPINPKEAPGY